MKMGNSLAPSNKKQPFSVAVQGDFIQGMIRKSMPNAAEAGRVTGTLLSAVSQNEQLRNCNPVTVVAAALRGEGMGLTYGVDYHLVPFRDSCTYILGYKGLLHLLISTGEVADTNCVPVLEGEYIGRNKKTKRPEFDFSVYESEDEEAGHPVIGYLFYVELKNGYTASEYMRVPDILAHANRYSQTFDLATYAKLENGEFSPEQAERIRSKSPWYGNFEIMAKKTVIRKLLNSGFVPLANSANLRKALDEDGEAGEGELVTNETAPVVVDVDVAEDAASPSAIEETPSEAPEAPYAVSDDKVPTETTKKPVGRPRKNDSPISETATTKKPDMGDDYDSFQQSFFGGNQ